MKITLFLNIIFIFLGCAIPPSQVLTTQKSVSQIAQEWLDCPPPNPRRPSLCEKACCGNGSNWHMSCITFVGEVSKQAKGHVDPLIFKGYSKNPPHEFGNPMLSWQLMQESGRAHFDLENIEPNSAVFFKIPTFPRGHVAIYTGEKNNSGEPLIITTGGYQRKEMRKESALNFAREVNGEILGWAKLE